MLTVAAARSVGARNQTYVENVGSIRVKCVCGRSRTPTPSASAVVRVTVHKVCFDSAAEHKKVRARLTARALAADIAKRFRCQGIDSITCGFYLIPGAIGRQSCCAFRVRASIITETLTISAGKRSRCAEHQTQKNRKTHRCGDVNRCSLHGDLLVLGRSSLQMHRVASAPSCQCTLTI